VEAARRRFGRVDVLVLEREAGTIGITDLLVVLLVADPAQNAMASNYRSLSEGVLLVGTMVSGDYALGWLGFPFPALRPLLRPAPLPLVRDGRFLRANMRRELIAEEELMSQLREQGVERLEKCAWRAWRATAGSASSPARRGSPAPASVRSADRTAAQRRSAITSFAPGARRSPTSLFTARPASANHASRSLVHGIVAPLVTWK
jgi:hypothetical protein